MKPKKPSSGQFPPNESVQLLLKWSTLIALYPQRRSFRRRKSRWIDQKLAATMIGKMVVCSTAAFQPASKTNRLKMRIPGNRSRGFQSSLRPRNTRWSQSRGQFTIKGKTHTWQKRIHSRITVSRRWRDCERRVRFEGRQRRDRRGCRTRMNCKKASLWGQLQKRSKWLNST